MAKISEAEQHNSEEWGAWKFVNEMLNNPYEKGIYPTSKCFKQIYDFVVEQKQKAYQSGQEQAKQEMIKKIEKLPSFGWHRTGNDPDNHTKYVKQIDVLNILKE